MVIIDVDYENVAYTQLTSDIFDCDVKSILNRYFSYSEILDNPAILHYHAIYELQIVLNGVMNVECGGKSLCLTKNKMLLISPLEYHRIESCSEDIEFTNLRFELSKNSANSDYILYGEIMQRVENLHGIMDVTEDFYRVLTAFRDEYRKMLDNAEKKNPYCFTRLKHAAAIFFSHFFELLGAIPKPVENFQSAACVSELRKIYIDKYFYLNIDRNISIEELAEQINYSSSQTKRIIRELYGMSFREKAISLRIEVAKKCLEKEDLTIEEIAELVGYHSRNGFDKFFLSSVGMSPAAYRQRHKK